MQKRLLFLCLTINTLVFAQEPLIGTIVDSEKKTPIEGAHIYLKTHPLGTTSNSIGQFQLLMPLTNIQERIHISHLNYEDMVLNIEDLETQDTFFLKSKSYELNELLVKPLDIENILEDVITSLNHNYHPLNYKGIVKQVSSFDDIIERLLVSEILVKKKRDKSEIYLSKVNQFKKKTSDSSVDIKSMVTASQLIGFLNLEKFLIDYKNNLDKFTKKTVYKSTYSTYNVYVIKLEIQLTTNKKTVIELVIEESSKALIQMNISADRGDGIDQAMEVHKSKELKITRIPTFSTGTIKYRPFKNKWMLSEISADLSMEYQYKNNDESIIKQNYNTVLIIINELIQAREKDFKKADLSKDLFYQVSKEYTDTSYYYFELNPAEKTFLKKEFANK